GNFSALVLPDGEHLHHERDFVIVLEPIRDGLTQNRWCEGPEGLTPLNLKVQDILHVRPARISQDGPISQGARTPLHAVLKPTYNLAISNGRGNLAAQFAHVRNFPDIASLVANFGGRSV